MKKIFISFMAAALVLSGCNEALDRHPLNGPASGTFPSSEEEALAGVLAAYKGWANLTIQNCQWPQRTEDAATDIAVGRNGNNNFLLQVKNTLTPETALIPKIYKQIYKTAGRVHLVLDNLGNLEGKVAPEQIAVFRAELLTIRGFYYDMACQFYGDIPFIDHSLSLDDCAYARTPRKEVTEHILFTDLTDETLDALPVQWAASYGTTRIGRVAAYGIKARIALNWGYYEEAARCARKALDLGEGIYGLEPLNLTYYATHVDGEPDPTPIFGLKGQNSKEWLWALQFNRLINENYDQTIYYFGPRTCNGCSWFGPSQAMMDTFQCIDGLSITESPLYDWKNPWNNRDPRLDLWTVRPESRIMGIQFSSDVRNAKVKNYNTNTEIENLEAVGNKSEYGANGTKGPGGYFWRKYLDIDLMEVMNSKQSDCNAGVIRFAELYLIEAEAEIELNRDLGRAAADINKIRARAGMPAVAIGNQAAMRKALRYERKVELAMEGFRWFDLRRWTDSKGVLLAEKALNGKIYAPPFSNNKAATLEDPYAFVPNGKPIIDDDWIVTYDEGSTWDGKAFNLRVYDNMTWAPREVLWPFPKDELDTNAALDPLTDQNPGW